MQELLDKGVAPPEYVLEPQRQREQLLSQWGVVSPLQRALFLELTESWSPSIDFKSFTAARSEGGVNLSTDLLALFSKLREARVGVLLTQKDGDGNRQGHRMILTSEGDPRFWYYHLCEWLQVNGDNPSNPYLTESILRSRNQNLASGVTTVLSLGMISKKLMDEGTTSRVIYLIPVYGNEQLVVPARELTRIMSFTSSKLRSNLANPEVANAVARIMNNSLVEIQKKISGKEALFWKGLCQAVYDHHEDLLAERKLKLDKDFIQAAEIFSTFLNTQLEETKRQKEEVKERDEDMKQVEITVKATEDAVFTMTELDAHLGVYRGKYAEAFPLFKEDFLKIYTQTDLKTGLPPLVPFTTGFVHRDNFFPFFLKRLEKMRVKLRDEFRGRMDYILRTNNRNNDLSFSSPNALELACLDYLQAKDSWLAEVLKKSRLVAEGLIIHGKAKYAAKTLEDLKPQMDKYFKTGSTNLKALVYLFDLDSFTLFDESFHRLPLFTQLIIRLSGRFSGYRDKFLLLSPNSHEKAHLKTTSLPREAATRSPQSTGGSYSGHKSSSGRSTSEKAKKSIPSKPKVYTKREQEAAWTRFKDKI